MYIGHYLYSFHAHGTLFCALSVRKFTVDKKFNSLHNLTMSDVEFHSNEVDHYNVRAY